jgi:hypothetical protein
MSDSDYLSIDLLIQTQMTATEQLDWSEASGTDTYIFLVCDAQV